MGTRRRPSLDDVLAPPARTYARVAAPAGTRVLHRPSRRLGTLVAVDARAVTLADAAGRRRRFDNRPGDFAIDGVAVHLVAPDAAPGPTADADADAGAADLRGGRVVAGRRTASGSRAVAGARARVARASRLFVEGVHDAELVERVWGDDLRLEGVVVERLDGLDHLGAALAGFRPAPDRRAGVLVDHLVPGAKEWRLAQQVVDPHVLVRGTPYVDVWQAIRPEAVGIAAWPRVPPGVPWKDGVCAALGVGEPGPFWRRVLASVGDWRDLEQPLVRAVEELVDFVTGT